MSDPQVQLPFAGGLNENIDERHLGPGDLVQADNVSFVTDGSIERRFGFEELTPNVGMTSIERLMPMGDRLLAVDGEKLWAYNSTSASSGDDFIELGRIAEATVLRSPVSSLLAGDSFNGYDIAYGNGMIAMAAATGDEVVIEVYDASTMQLLTAPGLALPDTIDPARVKIGWLGTRLVVLYSKASADGIVYGNYAEAGDISTTLADGGFQPSTTSVINDGALVARLPFGAYFNAVTEEIYIGYKDSTANDVKIVRVDSSLGVVDSVATNVNPTINDVAVSFNGTDHVMVALAIPDGADTGLGLIALMEPSWLIIGENYSTGCVVTGASYRCSVTSTASDVWYAGLSIADTDYENTKFMWLNFDDTTTAIGANPLKSFNVVLASSMFAYNGRAYAVLVHAQPLLTTGPFVTAPDPIVIAPNGAYYVVELGDDFDNPANTLRWIATIAPNIVAERFVRDDGTAAGTAQICAVDTVDASHFVTFVATTSVVQAHINIERLDIDFKDSKRWQPAELGGLLYTEGSRYDGRRITPTGWAWAPTIVSTTGSAGTAIAAGDYGFYVVYEKVLADGTIDRSARSNPVTVTVPVGGFDSITIVATTCGMCAEEPGYMVLYRTDADHDVWYRGPASTSEGELNDTGVPTVSILFTPIAAADLLDGSHPLLYTTGGAKDNATPPTFRQLVAEDNRLYGIGDDGRTVWYSKQFDGTSAPSFVLDFTFAIEDTRNILTGIGILDGRKVFFTSAEIFVMGGKGPSESGQGNDYNEPDRLPYAFGCTNWRSIVTTEDGLWFQSKRGIELLTRGLELAPYQELGAKVRRTLATYPYITSAVVVPDQSQVRFTCSATDDVDEVRDGRVLVWDTRFKRWSIHKYRQTQASGSTCVPVTALQHETLGYVWAWDVGSDALVRREKLATEAAPWSDYTSAWVTRTVKTSWLKTQPSQSGVSPTDGTQSKQKLRRIRLLAERFSAHGMSITLGYDYVAGTDARTFSEATITALGAVEQLCIAPASGKGRSSAVQVTIEDSAPATIGTGRGSALTGLAFEVHPKAGPANNIGSSAKG